MRLILFKRNASSLSRLPPSPTISTSLVSSLASVSNCGLRVPYYTSALQVGDRSATPSPPNDPAMNPEATVLCQLLISQVDIYFNHQVQRQPSTNSLLSSIQVSM